MGNQNKKAIDTLLDKGLKFRVSTKVFGFNVKIPFSIKPLRLGTILHLAKQRENIKNVEEANTALWEMFDKSENVKVFARCAAIAVLDGKIKIWLFSRILSQFFLWNLSMQEVHDMMAVVTTQMNARGFFFTTALVRGFEILERKGNHPPDTSPKEPSSEQSEK